MNDYTPINVFVNALSSTFNLENIRNEIIVYGLNYIKLCQFIHPFAPEIFKNEIAVKGLKVKNKQAGISKTS